jgi:putative transposase
VRGGLPFLCIRFSASIIVRRVDRYTKNTGAVFSLKYHLVWCPKYRRPVLTGPVERRLKALLRLKAKEIGITIHGLEIMPDHVHLFVESDPRRCVAEMAARFPASQSESSSGTAGMSLSDYLLAEIREVAERPTLAELRERPAQA